LNDGEQDSVDEVEPDGPSDGASERLDQTAQREMRYVLRAHPRTEDALEALATFLVEQIADAIERRGRARIALAGGSTPRRLYELLAGPTWTERIDWTRVEVFFGDERCVPLSAPESNYQMALGSLLDPADVPEENVFAIDTSRSPYDAAADYAERLGRAALDVVLLGIGDDGHTASLFPGGPETKGLVEGAVIATKSPIPPYERVSLSFGTINAARHVAFLVLGAAKAPAVGDVLGQLDGPEDRIDLPAAMIRPAAGPPQWFVDRDAVGGRT
jgi:6-phosphogluconolactonase